jgi:hypothetical protein
VELGTVQIRASATPAKSAIEQDEKSGCRDRLIVFSPARKGKFPIEDFV